MDGPSAGASPLTGKLGGKVAGYAQGEGASAHPDRLLPYPDGDPEIRRHLKLVRWLGAEALSEDLEFPVTEDDHSALAAVAGDVQPGRYVCLFPGSRQSGQRWPADRFASVGDCFARRGLQVVLIGARAEADLPAQAARLIKDPVRALGADEHDLQ